MILHPETPLFLLCIATCAIFKICSEDQLVVCWSHGPDTLMALLMTVFIKIALVDLHVDKLA